MLVSYVSKLIVSKLLSVSYVYRLNFKNKLELPIHNRGKDTDKFLIVKYFLAKFIYNLLLFRKFFHFHTPFIQKRASAKGSLPVLALAKPPPLLRPDRAPRSRLAPGSPLSRCLGTSGYRLSPSGLRPQHS
jgi:hypothetical protein